MQKGDIHPGSKKLFHAIVSGKVVKLQATGGLSHTRLAELLDEKLRELCFSMESLASSLRARGATTAANAG